MNHVMFASMRDELGQIVKYANAARNALIGAAVGGTSAVLAGQDQHAGKAMIAGALAPTVFRHPKKVLAAGALGIPAYIGAKAINTEADNHTRVGNHYTHEMLSTPPSDAGPWL